MEIPMQIALVVLVLCAAWLIVEIALTIRSLRSDLDKIVASVNGLIERLRPLISNVDSVVDDLRPTVKNVAPLVKSVNGTVDQVNGILGDVNKISGAATDATMSMNRAADAASKSIRSVFSKFTGSKKHQTPKNEEAATQPSAVEQAVEKIEHAVGAHPSEAYVVYTDQGIQAEKTSSQDIEKTVNDARSDQVFENPARHSAMSYDNLVSSVKGE